jgi:hypothetical protein
MGCRLGYLKIQVEFPVGKVYFLKGVQTCSDNHLGAHAVVTGKSEVISAEVRQLGLNLFSHLYIVFN